MAEFSLFHTTSTSGDGASAYTQAQLLAWLRRTFTATPASEGVLKNYAGGLAVSGAATPLTVATGAAVVDGFPYENDAAVSLAVPTPAVGTTGKRVVLRADYVAHTVRIALISSADGVSAFPALTQTAGVTWEISLATLSVTTTGVITVTDARSFAHFSTMLNGSSVDNGSINGTKIDGAIAGAGLTHTGTDLNVVVDSTTIEIVSDTLQVKDDGVDDTKVGNRVPQFIRRQGGDPTNWDIDGATNYTPGAVRMQAGQVVLTIAIGETIAVGIITYPVPFSNPPLVFATAAGSYFGLKSPAVSARGNGASAASQVEIKASRPEGQATTAAQTVWVNWQAIGAE